MTTAASSLSLLARASCRLSALLLNREDVELTGVLTLVCLRDKSAVDVLSAVGGSDIACPSASFLLCPTPPLVSSSKASGLTAVRGLPSPSRLLPEQLARTSAASTGGASTSPRAPRASGPPPPSSGPTRRLHVAPAPPALRLLVRCSNPNSSSPSFDSSVCSSLWK
eukprot:762026-Hanusia_phi.AAC.1